jgi:hypothetical protein
VARPVSSTLEYATLHNMQYITSTQAGVGTLIKSQREAQQLLHSHVLVVLVEACGDT